MNRPFFISDNLADEEIEAIVTGIGKEIPQNIMHLKGIKAFIVLLHLKLIHFLF